ncbi:acyltransferase family protein [Promicromonospora sukumoe]|uniref:Peptidoglycan/LPS O-acetylase OafA/YrhL n=1 Tax=Promicromonospora sukumoe TaxID=88382 RepID=A0A7W3JBY5_9MICO|nr:acyltransferase family protein [Promicromonospora sukumoe]MBA8810020.1 peptidoglycan/LPS O-acetylase OafA/YrhL [Promicromonospora sukumoe]
MHSEAVPRAGRIPEIHGLRGLALVLVVLFHLFGNGRVSGGVDVFLALTGFLVTRSLVGRVERGDLRLVEYYGRTFSRLSAPSLVVLAATAAIMVLVLPQAMWQSTLREIGASAVYLLNWEMIHSQLAYGAAGPSASPLQHFWSLAVQGQFMIVWPALLLLLAVVARKWFRPTLAVVTVLATAASQVFALHVGAVDQPLSYFHSGTRFWELGLGAALALLLGWVQPTGALRPVLGWLGLGLVVSSGFVLDGVALFPGPWALWPVGGALLVILGSAPDSAWGPRGLLEVAPLRFLADISFPLYLWHWPLLIGYLHLTGAQRPDWVAAVVIFATSTALAWLTHRFVERPVVTARRFTGRPRLATAVALALVPALLCVVAVDRVAAHQTAVEAEAEAEVERLAGCIGAATMDPGTPPCEIEDASSLVDAFSTGYSDPGGSAADCWSNRERPVRLGVCSLGPETGYTRTLLATGDSHSHQMLSAYQRIAQERGWRIDVAGRAGCHWNARPMLKSVQESIDLCTEWNRQLEEYVRSHPEYDGYLVLHSSKQSVQAVGDEDRTEALGAGLAEAWAQRPDLSAPVVAIRDNPIFEENADVFEREVVPCIEENGDEAGTVCARDREDVLRDDGSAAAVRLDPNARLVDMTDYFCGPETCPPVIGYLPVYADGFHVSRPYLVTLAPFLGDRIAAALGD